MFAALSFTGNDHAAGVSKKNSGPIRDATEKY
jgi:hypothetical protein